tara:strand:- start:824 stop:1489 length:666 start_codon:yes stop_codon:yes gene_type:complete
LSIENKINNINLFIEEDVSIRLPFLIDDNLYKKSIIDMLNEILAEPKLYKNYPLSTVKISQLENRLNTYREFLENIHKIKSFINNDKSLCWITIAFCIRSNNDEFSQANSIFIGIFFDDVFKYKNYGYDCRKFVLVFNRFFKSFLKNIDMLNDIKVIRKDITYDNFNKFCNQGRKFTNDILLDLKTIFVDKISEPITLNNSKSKREKSLIFISRYKKDKYA